MRRRVLKALELVAYAQAAVSLAREARDFYLARTTYSVSLRSTDPIYEDVHEWMLSHLPPTRSPRSLLVCSHDSAVPTEGGDTPKRSRIRLAYDDSCEQTVVVSGHSIRVRVSRPDIGEATLGAPSTVTLSARSSAGRDVVISHLQALLESRENNRTLYLHTVTAWNRWQRRPLSPRSLDSVVLAEGQLERIRDDLRSFLDLKDAYHDKGVPWHRGYLFHGPPGSGKTSLVRGLATEVGADLYSVSLADVNADAELNDLLAAVPSRSVLVVEDVDIFDSSHERRETKDKGVTLSGLLNALDGVATPDGLITILTSNRAEVLDPALVRRGRIDVIEELGLPDVDQATRMFETFYGESPDRPIDPAGKSAADITEVFKQHMFAPKSAEAELREVVK